MTPAKKPGSSLTNKGRSTRWPKHVRLHRWAMESMAYRHASMPARCLLVELMNRYSGLNNGSVSMSVREAADLLSVCKDTAMKAFSELQRLGFIRISQRGSFS